MINKYCNILGMGGVFLIFLVYSFYLFMFWRRKLCMNLILII